MKYKCINHLIILLFINKIMSSKYSEIEYRQKIISKYDKSFTLFSIKFSKNSDKIKSEYQKGIAKFEIDPNTFSFVDKTGEEGKKFFEFSYEELGLKPHDELFKNLESINFPENTDFRTAEFPDFPTWHIIVDGKDYQSNVNTEFYNKFIDFVDIKKIENIVIMKYNN